MKIAIATVQVPFISGGAEIMSRGLFSALRDAGHEADIVSLPFRFGPPSAVRENIGIWEKLDFSRFDCGKIDEVIALKFPAFYAQHPCKKVWLTHQHRSVYELYDTSFGDTSGSQESRDLRLEIIQKDTSSLSASKSVFTISKTVSTRLFEFNGVKSTPLYQPPHGEDEYSNGEAYPYIFLPSRLEVLKRQDLLVRAMSYVNSPVIAIIAGDGGYRDQLTQLVHSLGLKHKVKFLGRIDHATMLRYYRHALAVFFAPLLEDYGLVTLEAMLSAKPVITCHDSGGPTEFVRHGETGYIVAPDPEVIGEMVNSLWSNQIAAKNMGENAKSLYRSLNISWANVVETLLS
jgi:glycosyltransferase involved in cell wall biosynthesis